MPVNFHSVFNDVLFVIITDHELAVAVIALVDIFLGKQRAHEVPISIDGGHVIVSVALAADASAHQLLNNDVFSCVKIKYQIDRDVVLWKHFRLDEGAGHAIEEHAFDVLVCEVSSLFDNFHSSNVIHKIATSQRGPKFFYEVRFLRFGVRVIYNFSEIVSHAERGKSKFFEDEFAVGSLADARRTKKHDVSFNGH